MSLDIKITWVLLATNIALASCFVIHRNVKRFGSDNNLQQLSVNEVLNTDFPSSLLFNASVDWLRTENLQSLAPIQTVKSLINEAKSNPEILDNLSATIAPYVLQLGSKVQAEKRSLKDLLGKESTEKFLSSVENADLYDPVVVRSFLRAPAIEKMIGGILYEAIFEFLQRVDIIGNIVNNLPIIGPIRQQIVKEFKKSLDMTLGNQIKAFLASFNRIAVQRMADFVLSSENKKLFSKANRNLVDAFISKPVSSLVPTTSVINRLYNDTWIAVKDIDVKDFDKGLDALYESAGNVTIAEVIDIDKAVVMFPTIREAVERNIARFASSESGSNFIAHIKKS